MATFLPVLLGAAGLVRGLADGEEVEQPGAPLGGELGEEFAGGEFLPVGHDARENGGMDDGVKVILHDDPRGEPQPLLPPAAIER